MGDMLASHRHHNCLATIALFQVPDEKVCHFGVAKLSGAKITKFVEKPPSQDIAGNHVNAGYYIFEAELLDYIPYGKVRMEETVFPKLAKEGKVYGYSASLPYWLDIGTMESYLEANSIILERKGIISPG